MSWSRGRSSVMFLRLCSRAPWMTSRSVPTPPLYEGGVTKLTPEVGVPGPEVSTEGAVALWVAPYVGRRRRRHGSVLSAGRSSDLDPGQGLRAEERCYASHFDADLRRTRQTLIER